MKVDVFIRSYLPYDNPIREGFRFSCYHRWQLQEDAEVMLTIPESVECDPSEFHIKSKQFAEMNSEGDIYIVSDDDCMIMGSDFISRGMDIMQQYSDYGILTATSISDGEFQSTLAGVGSFVIPMHAVGGVAFVRKGILKEFNSCSPDQVDDTICQEMKRAGWKTGVIPSLKFNHLGAGYSISTKGCWNV